MAQIVSIALLLKGNQTEHLQANHQLTPDSIGFYLFFLLNNYTQIKKGTS